MSPGARRTVLIVEDDKFNRQIFEDTLALEYRVLTAVSGEEALLLLGKTEVDAILADQMLPERPGLEVLRHALDRLPKVARLMITASNRIEDARDAVNEAKVHGVLLKPVRPLELLAMVGSAIREVTLEAELRRLVAEVQEKNALLSHALSEEEALPQDLEKQLAQKLEDEVARRTRELRQTIAQLEVLALRDGLTGLFNHRFFQDAVVSELARAGRHGRKLALLFLDVDHFKDFNDRYGHPRGDELLRELARIITNTGEQPGPRGRLSDLACRYGGEEFVVLLPECDRAGGKVRAERLREAVEAHDFGGERVTISVGVAAFPEDATSKPALVEAADRALYAAKRAGRNRVVLAGS